MDELLKIDALVDETFLKMANHNLLYDFDDVGAVEEIIGHLLELGTASADNVIEKLNAIEEKKKAYQREIKLLRDRIELLKSKEREVKNVS
jgi:hypothetical protein